jgi:glycerol-3-phosphate acyltransferase PlsY
VQYVFIIIAYLVGSIPFGLILGKAAGIDVRQGGSGNIGATNVTRLVGKKIGVATLFFDVAKGFLPMIAAGGLGADENTILLCGIAAFVGHLYPVYLKAFVCVVSLSGFVSVGSLTAAALMPLLVLFLQGSGNVAWCAFFIALLIWFKHRENIGRLIRREEKSWKEKK